MAFQRRADGWDPVGRLNGAGAEEERRAADAGVLAAGTLACPACDAPVAPGPDPLSPAQWVGCPFCSHAGAVREFLTLGEPTRPARVTVRVVPRTVGG
jgi:hypothetical protein